MARSSGLSNFCPCSVYYFSCYPVEITKTIARVHWNILMPAPIFAARAERVLLVGVGTGFKKREFYGKYNLQKLSKNRVILDD